MNVSLTQELEAFVHQKVESGRYHSASEVVREALRLLEDHDQLRQIKLESLRKEIAIGLDQLDRGEFAAYDEDTLGTLFEEIRAKGHKALAARRKKESA